MTVMVASEIGWFCLFMAFITTGISWADTEITGNMPQKLRKRVNKKGAKIFPISG